MKSSSSSSSELRTVRSHPSMAVMPSSLTSHRPASLRDSPDQFRSRIAQQHHHNSNEDSTKSHSSIMDDESPNKVTEDNDPEEEGGHDTITSLAGAKMLLKYRRAMTGGSRSSSTSSVAHRKDSLVKKESLEDIRESDDDDDKEELIPITRVDVFVPPDGGYGWVVALGTFLALFWCSGVVRSYGVVFGEVLKFFPDASISLASWIPAIMTSLALAMAPLASALCQRFNCRYVTMAGSIICAMGISLSSLAPNVECLFATLGVLTGVGVGFCTTPGIILTSRYFDRNRAKANALCLSGTAAGSFLLPHAIEALVAVYGFRGALLLLGASMLHICVSAAMFRPLAVHVRIVRNEQRRKRKSLEPFKVDGLKDNPSTATVIPSSSAPVFIHPIAKVRVDFHEDPHDMIAALKERLNSLDSKYHEDNNDELDSISIASSRTSSCCPQRELRPLGHDQMLAHSFIGSTARSLPPQRLDRGQQASSTSSASVSRESLAGWTANSSVTDLSSRPSCPMHHARKGASESHLPGDVVPQVQRAKALSLRELYMHQLGSTISLYRKRLLEQRVSDPKQENHSASKKSLNKSALVSSPPAIVVIEKAEEPEETDLGGGHRFSMMFSLEDLTTDSTSILKDSRHAILLKENSLQRPGGRTILLNRSISENRPVRKEAPVVRRPRYFSESADKESAGPKGSRFKLIQPSEDSSKDLKKNELNVNSIEEVEMEKVQPDTHRSKISSVFLKYCDVGIVKEPSFVVMAASVMAMSFGVPHVLFFLPVYSKDMVEASSLLSITALFDLLGRLSSGFIIDMKLLPLHAFYSAAMLMSGLSVMLIPMLDSVPALIVFTGLYGLGAGMWMLMVPLSLSEYLGVERIASSYGMVRFFQSGANLVGPILGGYMWEGTGDLRATFFFMGAVMVAGSLVSLLQPWANGRQKP